MTDHITQSKQWAQFRLATPTVKKVLEIGKTLVYIHRVPHLPFTVAYIPRADIKINAELQELCKKENALFIKVEPLRETTGFPVSASVLPQHTIYVDLNQSEEKLLANMHEKTRYNIRLAQKKGVQVREQESRKDLEDFINLLEKTESRQGFYSHPANYYRKLWEILRPTKMVYLLSAFPMAAIMLFRYKDTLYYPYGGSDPKFREMMAPHLLHWEAIKLGKKLGCKVYDLWGSYKEKPEESDPWWGIYRFKSGFGGQEVDFPPTIDIPLSPLYSLYPLADKFRKLLR
ncbi:MAG: peptidoglycan bridge formation glycyltransferase FemA/FemB family protein [Patescibacteria group bacterium]|nr:peptidoglycan bridge formation glycyltransferase FemA/FemB family protein [Patescibacteria group bacterium]MCL5432436.1 peptidoglycan bridge formation glycyltransferase FemA/FemB family protein [Patescibacteria group bacterium]